MNLTTNVVADKLPQVPGKQMQKLLQEVIAKDMRLLGDAEPLALREEVAACGRITPMTAPKHLADTTFNTKASPGAEL
eukprot:1295045-Amphidinium_carterae.1